MPAKRTRKPGTYTTRRRVTSAPHLQRCLAFGGLALAPRDGGAATVGATSASPQRNACHEWQPVVPHHGVTARGWRETRNKRHSESLTRTRWKSQRKARHTRVWCTASRWCGPHAPGPRPRSRRSAGPAGVGGPLGLVRGHQSASNQSAAVARSGGPTEACP